MRQIVCLRCDSALEIGIRGYQPNELDAYLGEFQINVNQRQQELLYLFQDQSKELRITGEIELAVDEIQYLAQNAEELVGRLFWQETTSRRGRGSDLVLRRKYARMAFALEQRLRTVVPVFRDDLKRPRHLAEIAISLPRWLQSRPHWF